MSLFRNLLLCFEMSCFVFGRPPCFQICCHASEFAAVFLFSTSRFLICGSVFSNLPPWSWFCCRVLYSLSRFRIFRLVFQIRSHVSVSLSCFFVCFFFYFSVVFPNMLQCSRFCCRVFTVSEIALVFSVFFKCCAFVFVCLLLFFCSLLLVLLLCLLFYSRGSGFVVFFRLCRFCFLMRSCVLACFTSMCFAPTGHRIRPLKSVLFMPLCSPPTKPVLVCPAITHTHTKRLWFIDDCVQETRSKREKRQREIHCKLNCLCLNHPAPKIQILS